MDFKDKINEGYEVGEWCRLNLQFYQDLIIDDTHDISTEELIERYYKNHGLVLDRTFVIKMLEALPSICAFLEFNEKWNLDLSSIICISQN